MRMHDRRQSMAILDESGLRLYSAARDTCPALKANPGNSEIIHDMHYPKISLTEQTERETPCWDTKTSWRQLRSKIW